MDSIRLQQVVIGNQGHRVAGPLDETFLCGQLSCIIGPNGVGKSTLLRTISGYQSPMSGQVWLDETPLSSMSHQQRARSMSIVLTHRPDVQMLSVRQMVGMGRSPYTGFWGRLREDDLKIVNDVMEEVGLSSLAERRVHTLSDGEMQKTMIAKALAQQTPAILLDEPTSFLDFPSKAEMMRLLARIAHHNRKIILMSTHDVMLALRFADAIYRFDARLHRVSTDEVREEVSRTLAPTDVAGAPNP